MSLEFALDNFTYRFFIFNDQDRSHAHHPTQATCQRNKIPFWGIRTTFALALGILRRFIGSDAEISAVSFASEGVIGRNPVDNKPVISQSFNGLPKLIEIYRLLDIAIDPQFVTFDKISLLS